MPNKGPERTGGEVLKIIKNVDKRRVENGRRGTYPPTPNQTHPQPKTTPPPPTPPTPPPPPNKKHPRDNRKKK